MAIEILFEKETERKVQSLNQDELKSLAELCDKLLRLQGTIGNTEDCKDSKKQKKISPKK